MATVRVIGGVADLASDLTKIRVEANEKMRGVVRDGIRTGNVVAKDFAKWSAGKHGKHYPSSFTTEMRPTFNMFGTRIISGEYGPDIARPQGGMSFEGGSRNQKPHLDLARSADLIGPSFAGEVGRMADGLFWP